MLKNIKVESLDKQAWEATRVTETIANAISHCFNNDCSEETINEIIKNIDFITNKLGNIKTGLKKAKNATKDRSFICDNGEEGCKRCEIDCS